MVSELDESMEKQNEPEEPMDFTMRRKRKRFKNSGKS
jgi:hypothetical protein